MMKCPNCGEQMPENSLYCERCGEDIHIVPDFEPEVEFSLEETLQGIKEELGGNEAGEYKTGQEQKKDRVPVFRKSVRVVVCVICLLVLILAGSVAAVFFIRYNSEDYQLSKARECVARERFDEALTYYGRALELPDACVLDIEFEMLEVYRLKENKVELEYLLRAIINDPNANEEQIDSAYSQLIGIYRDRKDYQSINELLNGCLHDNIKIKYQNYLVNNPSFSVEEGYYTELQALKLSTPGSGVIYYTMDGSKPDTDSDVYTAPIILDSGDYTISAYFVSEYGIASDVVTKNYHIEIEKLPEPSVNAVSGDYFFPIWVEVIGDDGAEIFYTIDGDEPDIHSTQYMGELPLALGRHTYRFIAYLDGRYSDVVERTYHFVMNTKYRPSQAEKDLAKYAFESGKTLDEEGHYDESGFRYVYMYQYVTNISEVDDFYILSEGICDPAGSVTKTGSYYAANAYTGELFKVQIDSDGYALTKLEPVVQE